MLFTNIFLNSINILKTDKWNSVTHQTVNCLVFFSAFGGFYIIRKIDKIL
ncbi:hypothetical protein GCM10007380_38950 [Gottfriedia solisilvae]|uniref:Uncharacterized protein n=1 Tax=Gottfriedia solisilvae TaxID=1516104 RepID=A0A8J3APW4_9BACI|nr:hypothetical protein GCM10007380_38950 [Gottfriedia solisilvae]